MTTLATELESPVLVPRFELGRVGRVLVAAAFVSGIPLAAASGLGLIYVPFALVGSLLIVRRPRLSIGWILVGVGWGFATLVSTPIDASVEQFERGEIPLRDVPSVLLTGLSPALVFFLLTALALVFPSGRLPSGRWRRPAQVALVLEIALAIAALVMPRLSLRLVEAPSALVRNPFAVMPDLLLWGVLTPDTVILPFLAITAVAAGSLAMRFRRSLGVERQQLRWLGTALIFVVVGIASGFVLSGLFPNAGWVGLAWLPAIAAFVGVPVAILVAVSRYRLYEIDTIINRAIVYGLLTAILAGGSAAMIGLGQRLFSDVMGQGSDTTIVFTTLIVVTAFTPIKNRLQAVVDRRFKEVHGAEATLNAFVAEVRGSLSPPDLDRSVRKLLDVALAAYRSTAGEATVKGTHGAIRSVFAGTGPEERSIRIVAVGRSAEVEVRLAPSQLTADLGPLQSALDVVVAEAGA